MALKPPSPFVPTPRPSSRSEALSAWLVGLSWVLVLVLIPMALLAVGLEAGMLAGKPHG